MDGCISRVDKCVYFMSEVMLFGVMKVESRM